MSNSCVSDVLEHKAKVKYWLNGFIHVLQGRAEAHDKSKLQPPEKEMFDAFTPRLKETVFGSDEYKAALADMGDALKHHYASNRHHPEHFENGVNDMTLLDLLEMVADWMAAAEAKNQSVNLAYLAGRFSISPQLVDIIANTLREEDLWCDINGCGRGLCPPDRRDGHVEGFTRA
jgi:hypothetical protein